MRFFLILLLTLLVLGANGQVPKPFSKVHILSYPQDSWGLVKAPLYWEKKEWGLTLASAALIFGAFRLDDHVQSRISSIPDNSFSNGFLAGSRHWGDGLYSLPLFAGFYVYGRLQDHPKCELIAMNATKAFVLSRLLVQIPKFVFQRQPPTWDGFTKPTDFDGPLGGALNRSFPSGHVISSFAAAEVFRLGFKDRWWAGSLAYTIAGSVAIHRVASGSHWFSDVCTSAILGAAMGNWISTQGNTRMSLYTVTLAPGTPTLGLFYRL